MKNASMFFVACLVTISSFANPLKVPEKALKAFETTFTDAQNVVWTDTDKDYSVQFTQQGIATYVKYDEQGNFISSLRYYQAANLPIDVQCKIQKKFSDKKIFGVTEFTVADEVYYFVKLEDAASWTTVKISHARNIEILEQLKKS